MKIRPSDYTRKMWRTYKAIVRRHRSSRWDGMVDTCRCGYWNSGDVFLVSHYQEIEDVAHYAARQVGRKQRSKSDAKALERIRRDGSAGEDRAQLAAASLFLPQGGEDGSGTDRGEDVGGGLGESGADAAVSRGSEGEAPSGMAGTGERNRGSLADPLRPVFTFVRRDGDLYVWQVDLGEGGTVEVSCAMELFWTGVTSFAVRKLHREAGTCKQRDLLPEFDPAHGSLVSLDKCS